MEELKVENLVNRVDKLYADFTNMGSDVNNLYQKKEYSKAEKILTVLDKPSSETWKNCGG